MMRSRALIRRKLRGNNYAGSYQKRNLDSIMSPWTKFPRVKFNSSLAVSPDSLKWMKPSHLPIL